MTTKQTLNRIESTLQQLTASRAGPLQPTSSQHPTQALQAPSERRTYSFELRPSSLATQPVTSSSASTQSVDSLPDTSLSDVSLSDASVVQPFAVKQDGAKGPSLPKVKSYRFSSHRHSTNPTLATNLLKEIETIVTGWQKEFQQILQQIQALYADGPIVDGWLESHQREPEGETGATRLAVGDRLMDYRDEWVDNSAHNSAQKATPQTKIVTCQSPRPGYRLCGLGGDGQLWSRPCPPEQLPSISLAIARYQKLRQLLSRKQHLETHLSQLAETLTVLHSHLKEV